MALRLREDEDALSRAAREQRTVEIPVLRAMPKALRCRILGDFLTDSGVPEPEAQHIALAEALIFSNHPSARANFPGGVTIARRYGRLEAAAPGPALEETAIQNPGCVEIPRMGLRVICRPASAPVNTPYAFTVDPVGPILLRSRKPGDEMRLAGGTKRLKKLLIDRKIPAGDRSSIPVITDGQGILGVCGIGGNLDRIGTAVEICFESIPTGNIE